jgi:hypothetical protein
MSLGHSIRKTASIAPCVSIALTAIDHTIFNTALQVELKKYLECADRFFHDSHAKYRRRFGSLKASVGFRRNGGGLRLPDRMASLLVRDKSGEVPIQSAAGVIPESDPR